jgi:hypothetical protein
MNPSTAAPPLLDLLPGDSSPTGNPARDTALADRAYRLIGFALAEYGSIVELDLGMDRLALRYADPQGAVAMRRVYQQWVNQTEELLDRVRGHGLRDRLGAKYEELERAVGRTLAMLSVTLESLERADEQFRTGQTQTLEEVRRELRAAAGH